MAQDSGAPLAGAGDEITRGAGRRRGPGACAARRAGWLGQAAVAACGLMLAAAAAAAALEPATRPPPELFFGPPAVKAVVLSPSGRYLAVSAPNARLGRFGVSVIDLETMTAKPGVAQFSDADIQRFGWVDDERLYFQVTDLRSGGAEFDFAPGLFVVDRDGRGQRKLIETSLSSVRTEARVGRDPLPPSHRLLHVPRPSGGELIVGEMKRSGTGEPLGLVAKRVDVASGAARTLAMGTPDHVVFWLFDPQGEARLVATRHEGRGAYWWRAPGAERWQRISEHGAYEAPWSPQAVDTDGRLFVTVSSGEKGYTELRRFDPATSRLEPEPLVRTPGFDYTGTIVAETPGSRALGVRVLTDAETTVWFDARLAALQKEADARLPGRVNRLVCRRCDEPGMVVLVSSWSDQDPGQYWIYRAADQRWMKVTDVRPGVVPGRMATTDFERFKARDGLEIPVWVTRPPKAVAGSGPLPAVLLVHGGPWVRGRVWEWDPEAQFLASRGYVVIEPEFRSSTGYGQRLFRAGFKQFGRAMQDDLLDALSWAAGKGIIDPKRVCIAGASYGGYATLMGLARDPDVFRCGVAWVAVSDPRLMFRWRHDYDVGTEGRRYDYPLLVGDPVADAAMLESVAPVLLAARMTAPLLLAHGGGDTRVPIVHGERMRDALAQVGRRPEWVVYPDEGHGFFKPENRIDFMRRVEAFLARHLR